MQPIVQESVQDVLHMAYLQQNIAGQQQLPQPVQLMEQRNVPLVAKQRHLQSLVMHLVRPQLVQRHKPVLVQDVVQQLRRHLDIILQVQQRPVLMQPTVQESVQDVILMAHLQQPIAGLQQLPQHVQLLAQQNVLLVAKPRHFLHWDMHLVQLQLVQPHKNVQDVMIRLLLN